ncbi:MAG TPA: nucleotide sugar dehydrogenase [Anaerolineae bacterium]|nr:nucleotide sugar dehydrogenase [Anaerolineae bacterium]
MALTALQHKIEDRTAVIGVIGLGYVGLPVACLFAHSGFTVIGIDVKAARVEKINQGISPIEGDEPGLAEMLQEVVAAQKLRAATDYQELQACDVILISVETPVSGDHKPRYAALKHALRDLGAALQPGVLVIVESTIAPGTIAHTVKPLLERSSGKQVNRDFFLGHCPERVMPGRLLANLRSVSRVCGGETPETATTMVALYRHVVQAELDPTDCVTAELVKTTENAYRDVNIAFANEVALICEAVGGDVWKVRELVNKSPGRAMLYPGAGVGGHCITKDPWLLAYEAWNKIPIRLIPAARAVNDGMPLHILQLLEETLEIAGKELEETRILVLGYAYLEDSDDTRNSPSEVLVTWLREWGAEVVVHDPFVPEYQGDARAMAQGCNAVVVMVKHTAYQNLELSTIRAALATPIMVDGRGVFSAEQAQQVGLIYRRVGQG